MTNFRKLFILFWAAFMLVVVSVVDVLGGNPVTVQVVKKKLGSVYDGAFYNFNAGDKLVLTSADLKTEYAVLDLTSGAGSISATFSGEISDGADGQTLSAHIGTEINGAKSRVSYRSLEEAVNACGYWKSDKEFVYALGSENFKITLGDNTSYISVTMSAMQHKLSFCGRDYTLDSEGKVWIAVAGGTEIYANFLNPEKVSSGKVYSIDRSGFVDLGLADGILWADADLDNGVRGEKFGSVRFYTFDDVIATDKPLVKKPLSVPSGGEDGDFKKLYEGCDWVVVKDERVFMGWNVFKKGCSDPETEPHIFLPASGIHRGSSNSLSFVNVYGAYWSSTKKNDTDGYYFYFNDKKITTVGYGKASVGGTVRVVRYK
jgi:hypothetical protein